MQPRISIVTPSMNQGQYLAETLRSVLDQGYDNLEYIVCDGGSTDGSVEILERHRQHLAALVIEPDGGQSDALNKGFARATGDVLGWLNSDDLLAPGALQYVAERFASEPDLDILYGDVKLIDAEGRELRTVPSIKFHFPTLLLENPVVPQQGTFWRRSVFEQAGGIDRKLRFCMDFDLWIRMHKAGGRFVHASRVLGCFRLHDDAKTATIPAVHKTEHAQLVAAALGHEPTWTDRVVRRSFLRLRRYALQWRSNPLETYRSWASKLSAR